MKNTQKQFMKKQILDPKNLWIVNTRMCTLYRNNPNTQLTHSEKYREDVAVVYIGDAFIELNRIPNNFKLSNSSILPIEPTYELEEYADFDTLKQFPYEPWFDFNHVTLDSLKEADNIHKMKKYLRK